MMSILIHKENNEGHIAGVKITNMFIIAHLLFVDDIFLFSRGSTEEWCVIYEVLKVFYEATCMDISPTKSSFIECRIEGNIKEHISAFLPYQMDPINKGIKYLGYFIKSNHYLKEDWRWLFRKI